LSSPHSMVTPHVLQNKYDIYHTGRQLDVTGIDIELLLKRYQIQMIGYSPFSSFPFALQPLLDPILKQLSALKTSKTSAGSASDSDSAASHRPPAAAPADLIIQWMLQRGVAVIPRSKDIKHLQQNLLAAQAHLPDEGQHSQQQQQQQGFALTEDEMKTISSISSLISNPLFKHLSS
jgi:diketogulonate reductase-like aldo/keto reductase